ncbi:MAG: hypothetical protein ABI830_01645 [Pseudolabrys sp.]
MATAYWTIVGLALSRRLAPPVLALPIAPLLGWAVHSALALPLFSALGFTAEISGLCSIAALIAAGVSLHRTKPGASQLRVPPLVYVCAALLAVIAASAAFPKISGDAVTLASPIFDHSKVAMIDEMTRLGLPPGNPFFGEAGHESRLVYYYLWHFSAAELALVFGFTGWEADIALTAFTAFTSLSLMIGFAVWISRRAFAGYLVVLLAFSASLYPVLEFLLTKDTLYTYLQKPTGLAGWLFQMSWAPQHMASATCVVLSAFLLTRLARQPSALVIVVLAAVAAAGFQSSTWAGGFTFGVAAPLIAALMVLACDPKDRVRYLASCAIAGLIAAALSLPFLRDQFAAAAAARDGGRPIAFHLVEVFNSGIAEPWRTILDVPGYWLVLLMIEFPAIYAAGICSLAASVRVNALPVDESAAARAFGALVLVSLIITGYAALVFADNNDLGWRAILPGIMVLTIFAAVGLARWFARWRPAPMPWAAMAAVILVLLGLPSGFQIAMGNLRGTPSESDRAFAATPALWQALRKYAAPNERVANNPQFMDEMTPWPINISWALMANRRSCYAGSDFLLPFTLLPRDRIAQIEEQFARVFDGSAIPGDIRDLATRYQCRVVVLTAQDDAWPNDPFADSGIYKLAEENPGQWKIYRAAP